MKTRRSGERARRSTERERAANAALSKRQVKVLEDLVLHASEALGWVTNQPGSKGLVRKLERARERIYDFVLYPK